MINEGHPDLHAFYDALKKEKLVSEEEFQELHVTFALDGVSDHWPRTDHELIKLFSPQDAMPIGILNAAVDQLTEDVSTKVLGKHKLEDDDSVAVGNRVEYSCDIFRRLRQGEWFDAWTIKAAMQISDRPFFVRYGHSVPLDELGRNNRMNPVKKPLAGWAGEIRTLRQEAKDECGGCRRFGPLPPFEPQR